MVVKPTSVRSAGAAIRGSLIFGILSVPCALGTAPASASDKLQIVSIEADPGTVEFTADGGLAAAARLRAQLTVRPTGGLAAQSAGLLDRAAFEIQARWVIRDAADEIVASWTTEKSLSGDRAIDLETTWGGEVSSGGSAPAGFYRVSLEVLLVRSFSRRENMKVLAAAESTGPPIQVIVAPSAACAAPLARSYSWPGVTLGLAVADFNADGFLDAATVDADRPMLRVLLGDARGLLHPSHEYTDATPAARIISQDLNQDGLPDLALVGTLDDEIVVYMGTGDGSFGTPSSYGTGDGPLALAVGDLNADGISDLVVAVRFDDSLDVFWGLGGGEFSDAVRMSSPGGPSGVVIADLSGDETDDLLVTNLQRNSFSVRLGSSDGAFGEPVEYSSAPVPVWPIVADFDLDGIPDVACGTLTGQSTWVHLGLGGGVFGEPSYKSAAGGAPLAAGDLNLDGQVDLVAFGGARFVVLRNQGAGGFENAGSYPTGLEVADLAIGDVDRNGLPDVFVVGTGTNAGGIVVSPANAGGGFGGPSQYATRVSSGHITLADWNEDGEVDAAVGGVEAAGTSSRVSLLYGDAEGSFGGLWVLHLPQGAIRVATADFNGDAHADLAVSNTSTDRVSIFLGDGSGVLSGVGERRVGANPLGLVAVDLNADGRVDLATANSGVDSVSVFLGRGDGTFDDALNLAVGAYPSSIVAADATGDGTVDLVVGNGHASTVSVLEGTGGGPFGTRRDHQVGTGPVDVLVTDLNADAHPDLVSASAGESAVSVLLGLGEGVFAPAAQFATGLGVAGLAAGDVDGDEFVDLVAVNAGSRSCTVLFGDGKGAFSERVDLALGYCSDVALADIGSDGGLDILTITEGQLAVFEDASACLRGPGRIPRRAAIVVPTGFPAEAARLATSPTLRVEPNPGRSVVQLYFQLPVTTGIRIDIFDVRGRRVRSLYDGGRPAGSHRFTWDGMDDSGSKRGPGVYFIRLRTPAVDQVERVVLVH